MATKSTPGYELPVPSFWDPKRVAQMDWYVDYEKRDAEARAFRKKHDVALAGTDRLKVALLPIDLMRTFCDPKGQLYVGGRSGTGAVDDTAKTCEFMYKNARVITRVFPTMDTHTRAQIFHPSFWVDASGNNPSPYTLISLDDVKSGKWRANPEVAYSLGNPSGAPYLEAFGLHYVQRLTDEGKYALMVWPYHAMLGGCEHAFVPAFHEALFWHNALRESETGHQIKGGNPLTENYAVTHPEVLADHKGKGIGQRNQRFLELLFNFDMVIICGEAKSHCVAWSIDGILTDIRARDPKLAERVYVVEDLSSPVVTPQIDFTDMANAAYQRFADAGMNVVKSTTPICQWPGIAAQVGA